jgi:hypothetical protein
MIWRYIHAQGEQEGINDSVLKPAPRALLAAGGWRTADDRWHASGVDKTHLGASRNRPGGTL